VLNLRFRTRLALVLFLTMVCTSVVLMVTYMSHNRQVKAYVAGQTSDLLQIIQIAQERIPQNIDPKEALQLYQKSLKDAGLSSITVASPSGEVVASTNPGQVGKKLSLKKRHAPGKEDPIQISAELHDVDLDPSVEQKPYMIVFPIVQGDKVLGYAQIKLELDQVGELLRRIYVVRLAWILCTMLAGIFAVVYLAFRFTKPIDLLVVGARQVAQGNLYVSLPVDRTDEIGKLCETFNQMVERLRQNRELQERLNEAEKLSLLGRFAATVAHEVRNSLNFINLSIDQIRAKHADGDERARVELQRNLQNIKEEIGRMNHLVSDFLSAGRQMPPALESCDLSAILEEAIALAAKQGRRQSVKISADLPKDLPNFRLDPAQIKTCFLNILTNAIQAMPRGGRVGITAQNIQDSKGAAFLQLRFADTGAGIPPEDRDKVFAPFYSTKATGFGLGLAITRKIVEDHGGRIYVTDGETPGTVMVMELPEPCPSVPEVASLAATPAA
jgi:signal transduction histidine kinase